MTTLCRGMAATGRSSERSLDDQLDFLPDKLRRRLMPFQKEGVVFATKHDGRCLIADEMGLGKTLQALSAAYFYRNSWPLLIVVPSSMRYPWVDEVEKWFPEIDPSDINVILTGSDTLGIENALISIVTYGLLRSPTSRILQEALLAKEFKVVIVDESHYMKNRKSATSNYLVPLLKQTQHKILLTGTPALAKPEELFPQVDAICPGSLGSWSSYAKRFCNAHWQYFGRTRRKWVTDGASNLEELQSLLCHHVMIRRLKKDVLTQLPPKQRQKITFPIKDSPLKRDLDLTWDELDKVMKQGQMAVTSVLSGSQSEIATENSSFGVYALISSIYRKTAAVKIGPVKEYVKMLADNHGLKFIVFAHHHVMMDGVAEQLHDNDLKYIRIDGNTEQRERPHLVHEFQVDPTVRVALLSIKAAGVGLTLTAAQLVVFAELDWTPGVLEQCEDRAHRIGQKQMVHVHYLVAKGTIDEWVWSALARKTTVVTTTLNGKRQVLRVDEGNSGQVECLANADAWIPTQKQANDEQDIDAFFISQQLPKNQRSMLDYFTPKGKATHQKKVSRQSCTLSPKKHAELAKNHASETPGQSSDTLEQKKMSQKRKAKSLTTKVIQARTDGERDTVVLLDSDSDNDSDFRTPPAKSRRRQPGTLDSNSGETSSERTPKNISNSCKTPKSSRHAFTCTSMSATGGHAKSVQPTDSQGKSAGKEVSTQKWSCGACTFLNHKALSYCEICSSPKVGARSQGTKQVTSPDTKNESHDDSDFVGHWDISENLLLFSGDSSLDQDSFEKNTSPEQRTCDQTSNKPVHHGNGTDNIPTSFTKVNKDAAGACAMPASQGQHQTGCHGNSAHGKDRENIGSVDKNLSDNLKVDCEQLVPAVGDSKEQQNIIDCMPASCSISQDKKKIPNTRRTPPHQTLSTDTRRTPEPVTEQVDGGERTAVAFFSPEFKKASLLSKTPWNCPSCQTTNDIGSDFCDCCLQNKPEGDEQVNRNSDIIPGTDSWRCSSCHMMNDQGDDFCDGCLADRPVTSEVVSKVDPTADNHQAGDAETRAVDLDQVPTYSRLQFCCSKNTSRVYLYDENSQRLSVNFTPLDVEMDNFPALPDLLLHPDNLRLVKRFVREWNSLAPTKRRLIVKSGQVFSNPCLLYEDLKKGRVPSKQRFTSKAAVASAALRTAEEVNGTVRIVTRPMSAPLKQNPSIPFFNKSTHAKGGANQSSSATSQTGLGETSGASKSLQTPPGLDRNKVQLPETEEEMEKMQGIVQAIAPDGTPLCVACQQPYKSSLVSKETVKQHAWETRFCSQHCAEEHWMHRHGTYSKKQVFETEHGICQLCGIDAHQIFERIRITKDHAKRARLIQDSTFSSLKREVKERMVRQPSKGMFWQVDHITAVSEGGGQCDIDNLRTLCTPCHRDVTAEQNRQRAKDKRKSRAASTMDITSFFQPL